MVIIGFLENNQFKHFLRTLLKVDPLFLLKLHKYLSMVNENGVLNRVQTIHLSGAVYFFFEPLTKIYK